MNGPGFHQVIPGTMAPLVARRPAAGYPLLYKEDIYICLCRVYVISYRVPPARLCTPLGPTLRRCVFLPPGRAQARNAHRLIAADITKLSVSLQRIQFQRAGSGPSRGPWQWRIEWHLSSSRGCRSNAICPRLHTPLGSPHCRRAPPPSKHNAHCDCAAR